MLFRSDECLKIQEALQDYQTFMRERGADLEILDQGPLNVGTRLIGASVIGRAMHELPTLKGLSSGQEIIATRHLGDLSFLSMNRASYFPEKRKGEDNAIRLSVLQRFATPNLLLARKIRAYLPDLGKKFDPDRHIFFATDISGPGLAVLEEGANASGVDVRIDDMKFLDERSLKFYRKNQTSSTNGPILLAASRNVIEQIQSDLHASGYSETWRVGSVLGPSAKPCIELASNLEKRFASNNPRIDFFRPEVHFGEKGESKERVPIFQRFRFKN